MISRNRTSRILGKLAIHGVLIAGGLVFSLPFFWLLTTSFKADKEMFVLPPEWIPEIPPEVEVSPYKLTWRGETSEQFFGLGPITVQDRDLSDHVAPSSVAAWRKTGTTTSTAPDSFESRLIRRVPYDFREASTISYEALFASPIPTDNIRRLEISLKSDRSFHRLRVQVFTPHGIWRSTDASVLNSDTWKGAPWQFIKRRQEERDVLGLEPVVEAAQPYMLQKTGEELVLVRATLERVPWITAAWTKYTENYTDSLAYIPFGRFVFNTIVLTALNIVLQLLSCSLIAYGFSRIPWPGRNVAFGVLLATMMIPGQVVMIPQFLIWKSMGMYNTWGPLFLGSLFGSGFFIFLLRQFMLTIPNDLEDAAKIDGAGYLAVWRMVMLPLIKPALAALAIFQFMGSWNDFFTPFLYITSKELMPISLGLYMFKDARGAEYGMLMAASTMMVVPIIALFFFAQRYFIQGVTLTGLKG
jgi:multiple sugar transport system permease protein